MTTAMLRDGWWWPWWVSSLIDLAVVFGAVVAFRISRRRGVRAVAAAFVVAGLLAAVLAPIVMKDTDRPIRDGPSMMGRSG